MKTKIVAISLFLLSVAGVRPIEVALANDAPLNLMSGAAAPHDTIPTAVRMESEVVHIFLRDSSYVVDATFNFFNPKKESETIKVGFPKKSWGFLGDDRYKFSDEFLKFEAWLNGQQVEVAEEQGDSTIQGTMPLKEVIQAIKEANSNESLGNLEGRDSRWMVRKVNFPQLKKTTTRVRYEAAYQDFGNCYGARYLFGTGGLWAGRINNSKFIIHCEATKGPEMCWDQLQDESNGKKYSTKRRKIDGKTVQYEIQNFKPDNEDQIFMTLGCPN